MTLHGLYLAAAAVLTVDVVRCLLCLLALHPQVQHYVIPMVRRVGLYHCVKLPWSEGEAVAEEGCQALLGLQQADAKQLVWSQDGWSC